MTLIDLLEKTPSHSKVLKYGTAGFRDRADLPLDGMFLRMGALAVLRSRSTGQRVVGIMITASHNAEPDNGVKLVDTDGGMLSSSWEPHAERFANAPSSPAFLAEMAALEASEGIAGMDGGVVMVGRDTRPHSEAFMQRVREGVESVGGRVLDLGVVTTPQLHFAVQRANVNETSPPYGSAFTASAALDEYYRTLASGFSELLDSAGGTQMSKKHHLIVDGACGVGAISMRAFLRCLEQRGETRLTVDLRNGPADGQVNEGCGAEFVQKEQSCPQCQSQHNSSCECCWCRSPKDDGKQLQCSFDGDADRVVFHMFTRENDPKSWVLLDGDKIAALLAVLLVQELRAAGLEESLSLGVVQTAYANGASTAFLRSRGVTVAMAKTGVKYLHHVALEFDVGVYFEANGHGTVLFSEKAQRELLLQSSDGAGSASTKEAGARHLALLRLSACTRVINQAVGDALSDTLSALACLSILELTADQWVGLFADFPSRQLKQAVANKAAIVCSDDETRVVTPVALAEQLDAAMKAVPNGRCFVRPSGTEDVVRVYAEATTQEAADELAEAARKAMLEFCR